METFGLQLITKLRANTKNQLPLSDNLMLRKRAIIKIIIDQLKNISQIEHTRPDSPHYKQNSHHSLYVRFNS